MLIVYSSIGLYLLRLNSKETENTLDSAEPAELWARTAASMNSTFNCLIFYRKNKTLRTEGMKVIQSIKIVISKKPILTLDTKCSMQTAIAV